ncbi:MAG: hypothetical protein ACK4GQ_00085 [Candidatus Hadarchaeales archaeon]
MFLTGANIFSFVLAVAVFSVFVVGVAKAYDSYRTSQTLSEDFRVALEIAEGVGAEMAEKTVEEISSWLPTKAAEAARTGVNFSMRVMGLAGELLYEWCAGAKPAGAAEVELPGVLRLDNFSTVPCTFSVAVWRS